MSGWLYISDDGIEWSASHPVRSGEVPDARQIRRATNAELLAALKDAWEAHGEAVQSEGYLRQKWQEAESALRAAAASPESLGASQDELIPIPASKSADLDAEPSGRVKP